MLRKYASPARLALASAVLWVTAALYAVVMRPSPGDRLPPREQWGAAEEETDQFNHLVAGISAFMILAVAAAAACAWGHAARRLRRGSQSALASTVVTAGYTTLLAVAGARLVFHSLDSTTALGVLVPLLGASIAAVVVAIRAQA
ncbi:hypothetical protein ACGF0D_39850 [Kitasatospora sp. NPDC048298]|uniref:hypothetical protein n=1 Tax=Kitasatospora sp. NPDC048298 TaxID=3364049 RepID=UPI00371C526E